MLLEFDETTVSFDMNKGLPLDDIYGSQGVGFRRSFEIASFNNLYNFKGVRYRSQFSNLDQLGGRITTLEILPYDEFRYEYADVGVTLSFFPLMDPKIFQSLLKKGQEKATKKLLKGDDTFILNEVNNVCKSFLSGLSSPLFWVVYIPCRL